MGSYRRIPGCSCKIFAIFIRYVFALTVLEALGQAKIYDVDVISARFCATYQEIVRFDIPMDDSFFMHFLNAFDQLDCDHKHCFKVKIALARLEKVLKRRTE